MLANYLKIAFRTLRSRPVATAINVVGLAVGLAACLLIGLWLKHELSYDRFHPDAADIYRVVSNINIRDTELEAPMSPAPMARTLVDEFPEARSATRVGLTESATVEVDGRFFQETDVLSADSSFFEVFGGFRLRRGDRATALDGTNAAVLTRPTARKYFGTSNPIGASIVVGDATYRIAGVLEDVPSTSHLQFNMITKQDLPSALETQWAANNFHTYVRLTEGASAEALDQALDAFTREEIVPQVGEAYGVPLDQMLSQGGEYQYDLQRLTDIYLHADSSYEIGPTGSLTTVYVFGVVGFFILLIACINFMNLATARASERATEVGIRKAVGAGRSQLAGQFLGEAVLTVAGAFGLALGLAFLARPLFVDLSGVPLSLSDLLSGPVLAGIGVGIIGVGVLAGSYPAFLLARFDPSEVLKVSDRHGSSGGPTWARRGLVVGQFAISIALIVGTLVVWKQYDYIRAKETGLDQERVVVLDRGESLGNRQQAFLEQTRRLPGVVTASAGDPLLGGFLTQQGYAPGEAPLEDSKTMQALDVGARFAEALGVDVVAGRSFDPTRPADSSSVLLNRTAVERLGWSPQEAVGRAIQPTGGGTMDVVGVVENFHYQSLRQTIKPLVLRFGDPDARIFVRLASGASPDALDELRSVWSSVPGAGPFQYTFLDQSFDQLHRSTQQAGRLLTLFAGLSIFIACLGLFGLATYAVQRRRKEIGIRKALGATATQVVGLLSKEFVRLVGVAAAIALPLAYIAMQQWLQRFAYRTTVGTGTLVTAAVLAVLVAMGAVGYHALQAARLDPATTLRSE